MRYINFFKSYFIPGVFLITAFHLFTYSANGQFREKYKGTNDENHINGMSFISSSTGYVAFYSFIGYTIDSGKTFTHRDITYSNTNYNGYFVNLTFGFAAKGVLAFSADSLLVYGHYGTEPSILFSSNGGQTWKVVFHRAYNPYASVFNQGITDMKFPGNGKVGFAVHNEEVIKTTDRGQTWNTVVSAPDAELQKLSFPSSLTGYVTGKDKMFKTINGGNSWNALALPEPADDPQFNNIFFINDNAGYILDNSVDKIYKTINGSASWTKMNDESLIPIGGSDMYFANDSTGFVTREFAYEIYKTTDNGKTWEPCKRDNNYQYLSYGLNKIYFYNAQIAWAGGMGEYLMISTDGGKQTVPAAYFRIDTIGYYASNTVNLFNFSKKNYQYKWYKNSTLIGSGYNASYVHNFSDPVDTVKLVVSNGIDSDTSIQYQSFVVEKAPVLNSFSPKVGSKGTLITLTGSSFSGVVSVKFGSTPAASFTIISDGLIQAVPGEGSSGSVTVSKHYTNSSISGFTYTSPPASDPPVITSFSPSSGPAGATVTINGNNFNPNVSGNTVYFGAIKGVIKSASATQILCTVPTGGTYEPVTVLNTSNHLSGHSLKPFNVTFDSLNFTTRSFSSDYNINFPYSYNYVYSLTAADIDGDQKPDLVCTEKAYGGDTVDVYRNTSTIDKIDLSKEVNVANLPGAQNGTITMADLDGDGKVDFICPTNQAHVLIVRNTSIPGIISVDSAISVPCGDGSQMIAVDDLDGDGRPDLVVATFNTGKISILRNTSSPGNISFTSNTDYVTGGNAESAAIGDLDGDGKKDIVVANYAWNIEGPASFSFFKNTSTRGNISIGGKTDFETPWFSGPLILLKDIDGDNKLDVIIPYSGFYYTYRNITQNGIFAVAPRMDLPAKQGPSGVCIDNLNGDSKPDFVSGGYNDFFTLSQNLSVPGNLETGTPVSIETAWPFQGKMESSACADFNGDGRDDIAAALSTSLPHYISIFTNKMGAIVPVQTCSKSMNVPIESDFTGTEYQWQEDSGTGFENIADNDNFSGTKTSTLHISNMGPQWNGYEYRCLSKESKSSVFELSFIDTIPPTVVIATPDTAICSGSSVTFTATPLNIRDYITYQWQVNGITVPNNSTSTFTTSTLKDKDHVSVLIHTSDACFNDVSALSNEVTVSAAKQAPATPGDIVGPMRVSVGSEYQYLYSVDPVPNANTYNWRSVNYAAANLPQITHEPKVYVKWTRTSRSSDRICVQARNGCGSSTEICTDRIVLPLILLSFQAQKTGNTNLLKWTTEEENNIDYFEIERSGNASQFNTIGSVAAKNGAGKNTYSFIDEFPLDGNNYYRLKMVDKDGKFIYSETKKIENRLPFTVDVVPNPATDNIIHLVIRSRDAMAGEIIIKSIDGKVLSKAKINIMMGVTFEDISAKNLSSGIYFITMLTSANKTEKRFVIEK